MLLSQKISKRQSEVREQLATLAAVETPTDEQVTEMRSLDTEYTQNEVKYRAALVSESEERDQAEGEFEERSEKEYSELVDAFELRQVADFLDDGSKLSGQTAEVVQEMRSQGSYQGIPVPLAALEVRAGETTSSGTPDPKVTRNIIDQLFPASVMSQMGAQLVNINHGLVEWPVVTQGASTGWAATETGNVGAAQAFQTTDKSLSPDNTLGCQMTLTRKSMKQSGPAVEQAVRRDMNSAISAALDQAAFLGTGASGQPLGIVQGASTYGITETALDAAVTYALLRAVATTFMVANAATSYKQINLLMRHELLDDLDDTILSGTAVTDLDRLTSKLKKVLSTSNALAAPAGSPLETKAVMTTSAGGVAPFFVGIWGGVDMIRDVYTKAASGQLALTALVTADVTVARPAQIEVITDIQ